MSVDDKVRDATAADLPVHCAATPVAFIERKSRREMRVKARIVVLSTSACETVRVLLNSKGFFS